MLPVLESESIIEDSAGWFAAILPASSESVLRLFPRS